MDVRPNCVCGLPTHILGCCHFRRSQAWHETSRSMRGTAQRPQVGGRANLFWGDHLSISEFGVSPTNELFRFAPGCHGGGDKSDKTWMPRLFNASTLALIRHLNIFHYITSVGDTICWEGEGLTHNNEPMRVLRRLFWGGWHSWGGGEHLLLGFGGRFAHHARR